jgi:aminomethyltransferase
VANPTTPAETTPPRFTPLHHLHVELHGKIVDFAGWALPVQFEGIMAEHRHCRDRAGLFDVSHMGQVRIQGKGAAATFERLVPGNIEGLKPGHARYTVFTNDQGGVLDDLIVTRLEDGLFVVVNAGCRDADIAHMKALLEPGQRVEELTGQALLALQGPSAVQVLAEHAPAVADLLFMQSTATTIDGMDCRVSRLGYTGEDGFEISVAEGDAERLARRLLAHRDVRPIGLGARDSLRLEAGLCLYGHELSEETTPIEAGLTWTIGKRRRESGGFPGADVILGQLEAGPPRILVGLRPVGRAPAREDTDIQDLSGAPIGKVTSGGFGPSVNASSQP